MIKQLFFFQMVQKSAPEINMDSKNKARNNKQGSNVFLKLVLSPIADTIKLIFDCLCTICLSLTFQPFSWVKAQKGRFHGHVYDLCAIGPRKSFLFWPTNSTQRHPFDPYSKGHDKGPHWWNDSGHNRSSAVCCHIRPCIPILIHPTYDGRSWNLHKAFKPIWWAPGFIFVTFCRLLGLGFHVSSF